MPPITERVSAIGPLMVVTQAIAPTIAAIDELGLPAEDRRKLCVGNAERLLKKTLAA